MSSIKKVVTGLGGLLMSAICAAGSQSGAFNVLITLAPGQGMCVNETLNARAGVTVQVTCRSGQFVDISVPAGSLGGERERVYRLPFGPGFYFPGESAAADELLEAGVITGLHIDRPDQGAGPLTMMVTF